jgi:hypothetical protein
MSNKQQIIRLLEKGKKPYRILKEHPEWSDWVYKVAREWRQSKIIKQPNK